MKKTIPISIFIILFCSCADKFTTAKITVQTGRLATNVAQIGFDFAEKQKKEECLKQDPSQGTKYQECFKSMSKTLAIWTKSKATALAAWDAAEATIKAAELKKLETLDILPLVKSGVCVITKSLAFLPDKYKKKVELYLKLMDSFSCD
jgi:hypothetical protein